jgi:hypothetical protein
MEKRRRRRVLLEEEQDDGLVVLSLAEQRILPCLGAAVIAQWSELPTGVKKALFEHAVSSGDLRHLIESRSPASFTITSTRRLVRSRSGSIPTTFRRYISVDANSKGFDEYRSPLLHDDQAIFLDQPMPVLPVCNILKMNAEVITAGRHQYGTAPVRP